MNASPDSGPSDRFNCGGFSLLLNVSVQNYDDITTISESIRHMGDSLFGIIISDPLRAVGIDRLVAALLLKEKSGVKTIFPIHCRNKNRDELSSTYLGVSAAGIRHVVVLTGNHPSLIGEMSGKPVFDLDSTQLLQTIRELQQSEKNGTGSGCEPMFVGCALNPNQSDPGLEFARISRKMQFAPSFLISLPVLDIESSLPLMDAAKNFDVPVIYGVLPYSDTDHYHRVLTHRPGGFLQSPYEQDFASLLEKYADDPQLPDRIDALNLKWVEMMLNFFSQRTECGGAYIDIRSYPRFIPHLISLFQQFSKKIGS